MGAVLGIKFFSYLAFLYCELYLLVQGTRMTGAGADVIESGLAFRHGF